MRTVRQPALVPPLVLDDSRLPPLRPAARARGGFLYWLEREAGYWTGALAINTILVGGAFAITFVIAIVLTAPDIPVVPLLAIVVPIVALGPLVTYPFSKTLWVAVDRAFLQRLDRGERPDEQVRHY